MPVTYENAGEVIRYHAPTPDQIVAHEAVAVASEAMIRAILAYVPNCADQQAAVRHVREAKMTASAGIALKGLV